MKKILCSTFPALLFVACMENSATEATADSPTSPSLPLTGTWQLISGAIITGSDTVTTDYTKGQQMLKIINETHFAFLRHDLEKGKDTASALFSAGAGRYTLNGNQYTEHLDFCDLREWEGHSFNFTVSISNDTLVQTGIEKVENLNVDRKIIETYVRKSK